MAVPEEGRFLTASPDRDILADELFGLVPALTVEALKAGHISPILVAVARFFQRQKTSLARGAPRPVPPRADAADRGRAPFLSSGGSFPPKLDGYRVMAIVRVDRCTLSRAGAST